MTAATASLGTFPCSKALAIADLMPLVTSGVVLALLEQTIPRSGSLDLEGSVDS